MGRENGANVFLTIRQRFYLQKYTFYFYRGGGLLFITPNLEVMK